MIAMEIVSRPFYKLVSWDKIKEAGEKRRLDEKFRPVMAGLMDMIFDPFLCSPTDTRPP
jgi:hypothetical protein